MNLFQYEAALDDCIDEETGEFLEEEFDKLVMDREQKIDNICAFIKSETALAEAIKAEKMNLQKRQSSHEKKAESLKKYLAKYLNNTKYESAANRVLFRRSESVEYADVKYVPDEYLIPQEPKVDKNSLKKALKAGKTIEGVSLKENINIQIK